MNLEDVGSWAGSALAAIGTIALAVWGGIQKVRRGAAETKAAVAEDARDRSVADSQKLVYDMLNERLKMVEAEVQGVRAENRRLRDRIGLLEATMREHGIPVPPEA